MSTETTTVTIGEATLVTVTAATGPRGAPGEVSESELTTALEAEETARVAGDAASVATAASDATTKANAAQSAAEATAAAALATEATTRANADTALDGRLDTVETTLPTKADLVGGKVPAAQLPAIATGEHVTVADTVARLALTAAQVQPGDVATQADDSTRWLLADPDPSLAGSWLSLTHPADAVVSVNTQTGAVVLSAADVGADPAGSAAAAEAAANTYTDTEVAALSGTYATRLFIPATSGRPASGSAGTAIDIARHMAVSIGQVTSVWCLPQVAVPSSWLTFSAHLYWTNRITGSGNVRLRFDRITSTMADGVTLTTPTSGTTLTVAAPAQSVVKVTQLETGITRTDNPFACAIVRIADGSDTLAGAMAHLGIELRKVT